MRVVASSSSPRRTLAPAQLATKRRTRTDGQCGCGCVCPACGGLECLERPRYFAGQLLTEAELNQYMMGQPLQFAPGTSAVYSGWGFHILGDVITRVAGQDYEYYVREQVLAPMGVHGMSVAKSRAPGI